MIPTADELKERYASWSNHRLLLVIHHKSQYTAEAVEIARAELGRREITAAEVDHFLSEQEARALAVGSLSRIPLSFWEKSLFFFVWFSSGAFRPSYNLKGLVLKEKQSHVFSVAGFICLLVDAVVTVHLKLAIAQSALLLLCLFVMFMCLEGTRGIQSTVHRPRSTAMQESDTVAGGQR